jgi:putative acetyltransferase
VDTESQNEVAMLRIVPAISEGDISEARNLFREYASTIGVLVCLGDYERELADLPGLYAPPAGRLLMAVQEEAGNPGEAIGCGAIRALEAGACELKRLYVRSEFRGKGAARKLVNELIAEAQLIGYERMLLDTLRSMQAAQNLYRALGFREIPPYRKDPVPDSLFFELALR